MNKERQVTIDEKKQTQIKTKKTRQRNNMGNAFSTSTHHHTNSITRDGKHVHFINSPTITTYYKHDKATMLTYDSGADVHYLSEKDRK